MYYTMTLLPNFYPDGGFQLLISMYFNGRLRFNLIKDFTNLWCERKTQLPNSFTRSQLIWIYTVQEAIDRILKKLSMFTVHLLGTIWYKHQFNSSCARDYFCCLLIIFAYSLDPDQDRQNVGPDLDPNCLTL